MKTKSIAAGSLTAQSVMCFCASIVLIFLLIPTISDIHVALAAEPRTGQNGIPPIRIVMDDNYPPYVFRDDKGHLKGILLDQWRLWEKKTGIRTEIRAMDWAEAQRRMQAGEFDVIDTIFHNQSREKIYDFSKPYARIDVPVFFRSEISGIHDVNDLKGFVVAVKAGGNVIDVLRSRGITNLVEFNSYEAIISAARDHKVNVFTVDKPPAYYFLYKFGIENQFRATQPLYTGEFHRAVHKGNHTLLEMVENGFAQISTSEYGEIERRWHGTPILNRDLMRYLGAGVAGVMVITGILLAWLWTLRRTVAQRTSSLQNEIKARMEQERQLRLSEERMRLFFEHQLVGMAITSPEKTWLQVNDRLCQTLGYTREELSRTTWEELTHPEDLPRNIYLFNRLLNGEIDDFTFEKRFIHKNGTIVYTNLAIACVRHHDGSVAYVLVLLEDITEHKKAETEKQELMTQLSQAQKLESIGRLAGGIAHDFNNLLTPIFICCDLLKRNLPPDSSSVEKIDSIWQAADKARILTQQLLSFSRKQILEMKTIDMNEVITAFHGILRRTIRENIDIKLHLTPGSYYIRADRNQLEQIIMNLAINAQDSIEDRGIITIETEPATLDEEFVRHHVGALPGRYLMLAVSDTGCGMDRETLAQLFEPFFTTKDPGKGTGLGLATVHGLVKQHKGSIWAYSELGMGSVFKSYFPLVDDRPSLDENTTSEHLPLNARDRTILLVEDNGTVRKLVYDLLTSQGFVTIGAEGPKEALELAQGQRIDLLITDVVMPDMNGPELHRHLQKSCAGLRVLYMSGYTNNVIVHHGVLEEGINFIQKPFSVNKLAQKIESILQ